MKRALFPIILAVAIAGAAHATTHADAQRTARGTTGAFEVASSAALRAKAVRDAASPLLVRVNEIAPERYRIEYIGVVEGSFDVASLIERADGRAPEGLPDLRVEIFTQLPPNHGTDVFGLSAPGFSLAAHYSTALTAIIAIWTAVPAYFLVRRALRKKPAPPAPAPRAPTVAERLFAIVDAARTRDLDTAERGKLELLLLQELRAAGHGAAGRGSDTLADATAALRDDPNTAAIVRAVESWLHAPTAGDRARALEELELLRLGTRPAQGARA